MRRQNQKSKGRAFYIPSKKSAGNGIRDAHGSAYVVAKDGSLRRVSKNKHCTKIS